MNAMEKRQYEMLVRVRDFGDNYGHLFPASSVAQQNFAAVTAAVRELDAHELTHMAASVSARADRKTAARDVLLARLLAISQTARVIARETPGVEQDFQMPNPSSDRMLVTAGRKFARDAQPLSSQFVAQGMPVTFVADLDALVDSFERALRDRGLGREARSAARASTKAVIASGLAAVRSLNAIVTNHLRDDAVTRTVWDRDRRIVYPERGTTTEPTQDMGSAATAPESPSGDKAA